MQPLWWLTAGGVLGAIAGSFIAALVIRWPQGRNLGGRSECDACGATLRTRDLVPLLSYAWLRGRCARCSAPIDPLHPLIEIAAAIAGGVSFILYPGIQGLFGALFVWLLIALAVLDAKHFWLPDRLTAALALTGLTGAALAVPPALVDRLIGGAAGFASLALIALIYRRVRGRVGMGAGDPKLLGAIGLWLGWQPLPFVLIGASLAGLALVLLIHSRGRAIAADTRLPFGTLLAVAAWPVWLSL